MVCDFSIAFKYVYFPSQVISQLKEVCSAQDEELTEMMGLHEKIKQHDEETYVFHLRFWVKIIFFSPRLKLEFLYSVLLLLLLNNFVAYHHYYWYNCHFVELLYLAENQVATWILGSQMSFPSYTCGLSMGCFLWLVWLPYFSIPSEFSWFSFGKSEVETICIDALTICIDALCLFFFFFFLFWLSCSEFWSALFDVLHSYRWCLVHSPHSELTVVRTVKIE